MDIVIINNSTPLYEQIHGQIAAQILTGALKAGFMLPSIRTVAKELGVSIITIKTAWERLENDGLIYTQAGKGCFVCEHNETGLKEKILSLAAKKLESDLAYYKKLNLTADEISELVKKLYK